MPRTIATTYRPEMLTSVVDRLERLAGRLRAVADWMEEGQIESLTITHHRSLTNGLRMAETFGQAAERAVDDYRLGDH